jgi:hypothetical protein
VSFCLVDEQLFAQCDVKSAGFDAAPQHDLKLEEPEIAQPIEPNTVGDLRKRRFHESWQSVWK